MDTKGITCNEGRNNIMNTVKFFHQHQMKICARDSYYKFDKNIIALDSQIRNSYTI